MGRGLKALFNAAPLTDVQITADVWCYATPEETTEWGESYAERLLTSPMGGRMVEYGFATRAEVEAMAAGFRAWAAHPDAGDDLPPSGIELGATFGGPCE